MPQTPHISKSKTVTPLPSVLILVPFVDTLNKLLKSITRKPTVAEAEADKEIRWYNSMHKF